MMDWCMSKHATANLWKLKNIRVSIHSFYRDKSTKPFNPISRNLCSIISMEFIPGRFSDSLADSTGGVPFSIHRQRIRLGPSLSSPSIRSVDVVDSHKTSALVVSLFCRAFSETAVRSLMDAFWKIHKVITGSLDAQRLPRHLFVLNWV